MRVALLVLMITYVLSQFYRAFLAVLAEPLIHALGVTPSDLSSANGNWYLAFAAMQIPVGWALDKIGPKRTTGFILGFFATGGTLVFAAAQSALHINLAMILIGVGCSPILMASFYILGRMYSPAVFATFAGVIIGVGTLGNIGAGLPMTLMIELLGWRSAVLSLGALTLFLAIACYIFITDPKKIESHDKGSVLDILKIPQLWAILFTALVLYAAYAGLRGIWIGPYFADIKGASAQQIGVAATAMAIAMVIGNFAYGPADRIFGTRKWVVFGGTFINMLLCFWMFVASAVLSYWNAVFIFVMIGFLGSSFAVFMAQARSFFPQHLIGRGVTMINLFTIGGAGITQMLSGYVFDAAAGSARGVQAQYDMVFLFYGVLALAGLIVYAFSQERMD